MPDITSAIMIAVATFWIVVLRESIEEHRREIGRER